MNTEFEIRVLEVDMYEMINKLEKLGAQKVGDWLQRRYVYDFNPKKENEWIRLRTNGESTTLTYKNIESETMSGTKELEIEVNGFEETNEMLKVLGYEPRGYQENKRIRYILDDTEIDIDSWPLIQPYLEIEGKDEETVNKMIEKLEIDANKITALNCGTIYKKIYNIDYEAIKELKF